MHSEIKIDSEGYEPPLPPPAHFDLAHVKSAQPVKRLSLFQKSMGALQRIFGPQVIAIAVLITGSVIGFTAATAALDVASPVAESATKDEAVASTGRSTAEQADTANQEDQTISGSAESNMTRPEKPATQRERHVGRMPSPAVELRRRYPAAEVDETVQNDRRRPRLVSVIH